MRIGQGYDVHAFCLGRPLILGGVTIPFALGLMGHSDADVLLHAIADAIYGALAEGDIGTHFPPDNPEIKNIDSRRILGHACQLLHARQMEILNMDCTVICQRPKISPYREEIIQSIASVCGIKSSQISVKGKTTEGLGFEGRGEGIAAMATILLGGRNA